MAAGGAGPAGRDAVFDDVVTGGSVPGDKHRVLLDTHILGVLRPVGLAIDKGHISPVRGLDAAQTPTARSHDVVVRIGELADARAQVHLGIGIDIAVWRGNRKLCKTVTVHLKGNRVAVGAVKSVVEQRLPVGLKHEASFYSWTAEVEDVRLQFVAVGRDGQRAIRPSDIRTTGEDIFLSQFSAIEDVIRKSC